MTDANGDQIFTHSHLLQLPTGNFPSMMTGQYLAEFRNPPQLHHQHSKKAANIDTLRLVLDPKVVMGMHQYKDESQMLIEYLDIHSRRELREKLLHDDARREGKKKQDLDQSLTSIKSDNDNNTSTKTKFDPEKVKESIALGHAESTKMFGLLYTLTGTYNQSNSAKFYEKKTLHYGDNADIDHKQSAIDFSLQLSTLDSCVDRVSQMLTYHHINYSHQF